MGGSPVRVVRMTRRAISMLRDGTLEVRDPATERLARKLLDGNLADPVFSRDRVVPADITVVVPVRDRPDQLRRCLAALSPLRILVVDDASTNPLAVEHAARCNGADYLYLGTNVGPAGARNAGLNQVSTPLVAFVDSDVEVHASALLTLARHCDDPQVALVGPAVVGRTRSSRPKWFERYDVAASSLDLGKVGGRVSPGAAVGWLPSACLVARTGLLAGGFDDSMRVGEDVDLVWRLGERGLSVRYDPSVTALHDVRPTVREWLGRKFLYGTGGADLASRHGSNVAPAVLSPVMAVGAAAALIRRPWSAAVAGAALVASGRLLQRALPLEKDRTAVVARLSARGLGWALRQEAGLLLRHWWPIGVLLASCSRNGRRAFFSAVAIDTIMFVRERPGVGLTTVLVARRLDDMAYGSGLWWGALRARDPRCLLPRRPGERAVPVGGRR